MHWLRHDSAPDLPVLPLICILGQVMPNFKITRCVLLQALNDWLKSSNFKIASAGIECVALVLEVAPDASSPYIADLVPTIRDKCLSDSKDQIRAGGLDLLMMLMDIGSPQEVFDIMASVGLGLIMAACSPSLLPLHNSASPPTCGALSNQRNIVRTRAGAALLRRTHCSSGPDSSTDRRGSRSTRCSASSRRSQSTARRLSTSKPICRPWARWSPTVMLTFARYAGLGLISDCSFLFWLCPL